MNQKIKQVKLIDSLVHSRDGSYFLARFHPQLFPNEMERNRQNNGKRGPIDETSCEIDPMSLMLPNRSK